MLNQVVNNALRRIGFAKVCKNLVWNMNAASLINISTTYSEKRTPQ